MSLWAGCNQLGKNFQLDLYMKIVYSKRVPEHNANFFE
jgi:hypothetical protein